jgi:hypothetical protein
VNVTTVPAQILELGFEEIATETGWLGKIETLVDEEAVHPLPSVAITL